MDAELQEVSQALLTASRLVESDYFQLPVAGREEPEYRERVYCYELYHQWRQHWPKGLAFSLAGEVDKFRHPIIRRPVKPDFLVHSPGTMFNLLAMEVKPANAAVDRIVDDIEKLSYFTRSEPNYCSGYLWIYGLTEQKWPELRVQLLERVNANRDFDRQLVRCVLHEAAGSQAKFVSWA
jgi:hypothetical protein